MKTLLEFFIKHFGFLYLDARYRITDSTTSGVAIIDAGLTLTGPTMTWRTTGVALSSGSRQRSFRLTRAVAPSDPH